MSCILHLLLAIYPQKCKCFLNIQYPVLYKLILKLQIRSYIIWFNGGI